MSIDCPHGKVLPKAKYLLQVKRTDRKQVVNHLMHDYSLKKRRLLMSLSIALVALIVFASSPLPLHSASADITSTVTSTPDFSVTAAASSLSIPAGGSGSDMLTVTSLGGFMGNVALTNGTLPTGVSVTFKPDPVAVSGGGSASSLMTIFGNVQAGTSLVVTVTGTSGTLSHSIGVSVTFTPSVSLTSDELHWLHELSLSKTSNTQSYMAIVANVLGTSVYAVVRITGQSTTIPSNSFDMTCGVVCVSTNGNVNNAALSAGPVKVPVTTSFSFSFNQTIGGAFSGQKVAFTATIYWTTSATYGATNSKSGLFAVDP